MGVGVRPPLVRPPFAQPLISRTETILKIRMICRDLVATVRLVKKLLLFARETRPRCGKNPDLSSPDHFRY